MYSDMEMIRPFLLVGAVWLLVLPSLSKAVNRHRALVAGFAAAMALRYILWRFFATVLHSGSFWIWIVFACELAAFAEVCIFLLIMSRKNCRSEEAGRYEKELRRFPSVDVFIPTYNEGIEILEKSIIGAKYIDYPDFKVWVLDDGRREWLRKFCIEQRVGYLTRPDNLHAKAGNLNSGFAQTSGELAAVFDADFVPTRHFLHRTVGFFLHDESIGIVQTPQHFFNRDPVQLNLGLERLIPDEQRLFFDSMASCRDAWGAAFCCGSCSVLRRKAVMKIGGIPTASITEDLLTTLTMLEAGYKTIYLNEALSFGMSSESLDSYFIQRGRWCRGGIQCFFVKQGPLRAKGLSMLQRILFSPYSWLLQPFSRFMMLTIPLAYLFFDLRPLDVIDSSGLIAYQFPLFPAYFMTMRWFTGKSYLPLLSSAVNVFGMFRIFPVALSSLIKPFGEPFRVTPKGSASKAGTDWFVFTASLTVIVLSFAGLAVNLVPEYRIVTDYGFFHYAVFWTSLNIFLLIIALVLCFDAKRPFAEEQFTVNETVSADGLAVRLKSLSLEGGIIEGRLGKKNAGLAVAGINSELRGSAEPFGNDTFIRFGRLTSSQREELIVKLFSGDFDNEIREAGSTAEIIRKLFARAFIRER